MKENWTYKKLGEIGKISSGKSIPSEAIYEEYAVGLYPCYGGNGLRGYVNNFLYEGSYPIIGRVGALCGNVHLVEGKFYPTEHALVMSIKGTDYPKFVKYLLKSMNLNQYAKGVAQPVLSASALSELVVPVPPIETQSRIVSELDLLQSIIDKQQAQLKELDKLAQAVFYDMFGDPVENEKGWEVKKLGDVCELKAGKSIKASELSNLPAEGLFPCYGGNGIRGFIAKKSHNKTYPIIGRQGALCGNVNMAQAPFYATEHAVVVTPSIALDVEWLYFQLKAMRLNQYAHGVAQPGLSVQDLTPLYMIVPPINLQQSFAAKIESIEKQKAAISQSIAETQKLFDYTMDKYFG